jgi:mono/diheme cytochrome c family protein
MGRRTVAFAIAWIVALLTLSFVGTSASAGDQRVDAQVFRGGLVYANHCVTCHGLNADGNGRAARLYDPKPANLRMSDKDDAYFGRIIRRGGEAMSRSPFMPSWGDKLTEEQTNDLVAYLRSINARPKS